MKRILNIRTLFFCAVSLGLGIAAGSWFTRYGFLPLWIGAGAAVPLLAFLFLFSRKRTRRDMAPKPAAVSRTLSRVRVPALSAFLCFLLGVSCFVGSAAAFERDAIEGVSGTVTGRVIRFEQTGERSEVWLEEATLSALEVEAELKGVTVVYVEGGREYLTHTAVGSFLTVSGSLYSRPARTGNGIDGYSYKNDLRYTMQADAASILSAPGPLRFWEKLRAGLKDVLFRNMAPELYGTAYGMLTGDTSAIGDTILKNFRTAGLAHVFAVSGLHVGFLVLCLGFVFKKLRVNPWIGFALIACVVGFYAAFCGWGSSVLRAGIMVLFVYAAKASGCKYDSLTALSAAFLFTLLLRPLALFEVGFQMSYSVMFCLFALAPPLKKLVKNERVAQAVAAEIGILPVSVAYFHTFSLFGALVNIVFLPVISVLFVALMISCILAALFPFLGFLLKIPEVAIFFVVFVTGGVAAVPYAEVALYSLGGLACLYYLAAFLASRYVLARPKAKTVLCGLFAACFALGLVVWEYAPLPAGNAITVFGSDAEQNALFEFAGGKKYFITSASVYNCGTDTEAFFRERRIRELDGVIVCSLNSDYLGTLELLARSVRFSRVFLPFSEELRHQTAYDIMERQGVAPVFVEHGVRYDGAFTVHMDSLIYGLETENVLYLTQLNAGRLERIKRETDANFTVVKSERYIEELNGYFLPDLFLSHANVSYVTGENYYSAERYGALRAAKRLLLGKWAV